MMTKTTKKMILSAMFLSLGLLLPFLTMQVPQIGKALLPMHIPVLLCGFICGWQYGMMVGAITPLLRSAVFSMPVLFPTAAAMAFELAAYGLLCGLTEKWISRQRFLVYPALLTAMVGGRLVYGAAMFFFAGISPKVSFGFPALLAGTVLEAIPGILLQIVLIPAVILVLKKAKLLPLR